jgi:glycosidase
VLPPANWHGGDWRGIRRKIEEGYFDALGVNTLWIAPLNRNPA